MSSFSYEYAIITQYINPWEGPTNVFTISVSQDSNVLAMVIVSGWSKTYLVSMIC